MQKLINEQARMKIGSDEYVIHTKRIRELRGVLDEHNRQLKTVKKGWFSIGNMSDFFNRYFGMITAAVASFAGVVLGFKKLLEEVAKMDDVYSDVSKTTNLTRNQVVALNEEFKKMDTRTSREELNKLAADAGKLGITGQKDILDFVDAGNQIKVALGEDLGEDAIKNIGKITEVFKSSTVELQGMDLKKQMLSVGSAINELGQSSTASESYLVDFAQRLGGVASQAGISIQNILGYASALDQSGEKVEMSATALQNFIMKLMADPAKFAKLAGQDVKKFTDLLGTDANAAIVQVLTSLNSKGGFQALIPIFDEMGLDGSRAVGVLSQLAGKINLVTEAQEISNKGFIEATSITNEYDKKNTNLQAQLEKSRKAFKEQSLLLGEKLGPALVMSTNGFTYLIKALTQAPAFLKENRTLLLSLAGALATYVSLSAGAAIQTKVISAATTTLNGLKKAYNTIIGETLVQKAREEASDAASILSLETLLTKEQQAILQKKNLSRENGDYAKAVQVMVNQTTSAAQTEVNNLVKEANAHKVAKNAKLANKAAAESLVIKRQEELVSAQLSGNATRISAAEKRLETAVNRNVVASSEALSAQKAYEASKTRLATAATQNNTITSKVAEAQNDALAASTQIASTATARLTLMMKALWASMKSNPIGWILTIVSLATTAFGMFSGKTKETTDNIKLLNEEVDKEKMKIDVLYNKLQLAAQGTIARKKAVDELNSILGEYNIALVKEGDGVDVLKDRYDQLTTAIKDSSAERLKHEGIERIGKEQAESQKTAIEELSTAFNDLGRVEMNTYWKSSLSDGKTGAKDFIDNFKKSIENISSETYSMINSVAVDALNNNDNSLDAYNAFYQKITTFLVKNTGIDYDQLADKEKQGWDKFIKNILSKDVSRYFEQVESSMFIYRSKAQKLTDQFGVFEDKKSKTPITDNTALLKEISILTDKQKLQEYIQNQDPTIKAAAKSRLSMLMQENSAIEDLIKTKEKELETIQNQPARTKEEITVRNLKVKALQDEINELKNLGTVDLEKQKKEEEELVKAKTKVEENLFKQISEIRVQLGQEGLTESVKEILQTQKKYDELLAICEQYGLDEIDVLSLQEEEMSAISDKYQKQSIAAFIAARKQIDQAVMSSSEKQKADIWQKYTELIALAEEYGIDTIALKQKMDEELASVKPDNEDKDIFGMSPEDWEDMTGKIQMALDIASQLSDIWGQFNQIQANKEKKELQDYEKGCNKKKELLNKQLNSGKISQEKYNAQVAQLDADLEKKKTEMARKQAKRDKAVALTNAILNTASSIMRIWAEVPKGDFGIMTGILTGIAAAAGAAQIGVIMSEPLPEFAKGGPTNGAKMYIAGEAGTEWIAPNKMLEDPITGPIIRQLEMVRSGILSPQALAPITPDFQTMTVIPMYATGGFTGNNATQQITNNTIASPFENQSLSTERLDKINENICQLCEYLSDPRNRQAVISNDLLQKNDKEMKTRDRLKRL